MGEIIFLFISILLYLYSFIYRNIAISALIISTLCALYLGLNPIFIWAVIFVFTVVRFTKERIKDEF